jgi:hypothetical protein
MNYHTIVLIYNPFQPTYAIERIAPGIYEYSIDR